MQSRNQRGFALIAEIIIFAVVAVVVVIGVGTAMKHRPDTKLGQASPTPLPTSLRGVAFSPHDYTVTGITDFYNQVSNLGKGVGWYGDWAELADTTKAPYSISRTARNKGLEPIILVGTHSSVNGRSVATHPFTPAAIAAYQQSAVAFARANHPRYFGMGNEVNLIASSAPADFEALVKLVNETAAAVKAVSPQTKTFVTFQLEHMKGLGGGLFGGQNNAASQWDLLSRFDVDILAFTTYPGMLYHSPGDMPQDYYSQIMEHTSKPVAFSEVGWASANIAAGWSSSPDIQGRFAKQFVSQTKSLAPPFSMWLMLYDQSTAPAFKSMGLIESNGVHRPAFAEWQSR